MLLGFRFQTINLRISTSGQRVYFNTDSFKDFAFIKGIALSVKNEGALYGSTFGFRVNEKEILDESHEAHLLVFANDTAPNKRMLFFETPVPINSSKIEGIYTDTALQVLLGNTSYNPAGGVIAKNEVNVKKTYVSGKEVVKFSNFIMDEVPFLFSGTGGGFNVPAVPVVTPELHYPYDVKVTLLLTKSLS